MTAMSALANYLVYPLKNKWHSSFSIAHTSILCYRYIFSVAMKHTQLSCPYVKFFPCIPPKNVFSLPFQEFSSNVLHPPIHPSSSGYLSYTRQYIKIQDVQATVLSLKCSVYTHKQIITLEHTKLYMAEA